MRNALNRNFRNMVGNILCSLSLTLLFPIMFLAFWIFTLTRNMVGNIFCSQSLIPLSPEPKNGGATGTQSSVQCLFFCRTSHAKCKKGLGLNESPPLANGNLAQSKKTTSNTRFPTMFLEMFLGFWSSRNIIGTKHCAKS